MGSTAEQSAQWRQSRKAIKCLVRDCVSGSSGGRGYCHAHYRRWREGLPMNAALRPRVKNDGPCKVKDCEKPSHTRGWCRTHYARFYRNGTVGTAAPLKRAKGDGSCDQSTKGYHVISVAGRRRSAHRVAMEQLLGRDLLPKETVHHVNGHRSDNRTDGPLVEFRSGNLELWSSAQPAGQRVQDKVAFAVEILRQYAPHLLADG